MYLKPDKEIDDLSRMSNASIRGWINYFGKIYKSQLHPVLRHMNDALVKWVRRKYKKLEKHKTRAIHWLGRLAKNLPKYLHTGRLVFCLRLDNGSRMS